MVESFFCNIPVNRLRRELPIDLPCWIKAVDEYAAHRDTNPKSFSRTNSAKKTPASPPCDPVRRCGGAAVRVFDASHLRLHQTGNAVLPYPRYLMQPYVLSIELEARKASYSQALVKPSRRSER